MVCRLFGEFWTCGIKKRINLVGLLKNVFTFVASKERIMNNKFNKMANMMCKIYTEDAMI